MSKKKIAIAAGAAAVAIGAGIGVGTYANFSSGATATPDHTVSDGTLVLDPGGVNQVKGWAISNLAPSDEDVRERTFVVKNTGSVAAGKLNLSLVAYGTASEHGVPTDVANVPEEAVAENGPGATTVTPNSELPKKLKVRIYFQVPDSGSPDGWSSTKTYLTSSGGDGLVSLMLKTWGKADFWTGNLSSTALPANFKDNAKVRVTVGVNLPASVGNEAQGDEAALELSAAIEQ